LAAPTPAKFETASIAVSALREADLTGAEGIFRLAFGTFLGSSQPETFWSDRDYFGHVGQPIQCPPLEPSATDVWSAAILLFRGAPWASWARSQFIRSFGTKASAGSSWTPSLTGWIN